MRVKGVVDQGLSSAPQSAIPNPKSAIPPVALCNLGCSKNIVDGERMLGWFRAAGYPTTDDYARAGIIIVNTCAFIKEASQEAIDSVLEMAGHKTTGQCRTLVVAGCFSQRYRDEVAREFPEVDVWVSTDNWETEFSRRFGAPAAEVRRSLTGTYGGEYLKIAEGCSHGCAFCVIPSIRGAYRSRPEQEIVDEARWLYDQGVRECILVSQDTSYYGRDTGSAITGLLGRLLKDVAFPWIRLMYLNPRWVDESLVRLIASEPRLCSYYDVPLQHVADPVLRAMRRSPLSRGTRDLVMRIRTLDPRAAIRTSFIVGFPGETDRHFRELVAFVEEARFDKMGVFPFSPEEGTPAASLRPRPRNRTVMARCEELMSAQREISREVLAARKGTVLPVMIDGPSEVAGYGWEGRTEFDAPEVDGRVFLAPAGGVHKGGMVQARITETGDYDLYGEVAV